jgi:hypothetical protein
MSLRDQIDRAIAKTNELFPEVPPIPEGATVESLWAEILILKGLIKKPKVQSAIRLLLEDPKLAGVPIPLLASIIKTCFEQHNFDCNCSESSIRWYISQKTLEWNIVRRNT